MPLPVVLFAAYMCQPWLETYSFNSAFVPAPNIFDPTRVDSTQL